ncbi:MAG: PA14 domain-containing protein [Candidatus Sumerlaeota bacterium]
MKRVLLTLLLAILLFVPSGAAAKEPTLKIDRPWRGFHCFIPLRKDREKMKRLVDELANMGVNVMVLEVDYRFNFRSHPEIGEDRWYNFEDARELAAYCRKKGVALIPQMECVGHQSDGPNPQGLLKAHPEFDETPTVPYGDKSVYCREWCVSNPDVYPIVFSLIDEISDAFQAKAFHVGMDEIFYIGDKNCPRCKDKDHSELLAVAINKLHTHIVDEKKMMMLMWADRLLDGKATKYGKWEGSTNDTWRAVDMIPKDIVLCDWHYEVMDDYPSPEIFLNKGFRVWPAPWRNETATINFLRQAKNAAATSDHPERMLGALFTTWVYPDIFGILYGEGDPALSHPYYLQAAHNVQVGLKELGVETTPFPPTFKTDALAFTDQPALIAIVADDSARIRYTVDGSDVTRKSPLYKAPLSVSEPTIIHARAFNKNGASLIARAEIKKVKTLPAPKTESGGQGLKATIYKGRMDKYTDFADLEALREDNVKNFDPMLKQEKNKFGIDFTGLLKVEKTGIYTFYLASDDGSTLWLNDELIVDNDGSHKARWREAAIALEAGYHRIRVTYFNDAGDGELQVEWKGAGMKREKIPDSALFQTK